MTRPLVLLLTAVVTFTAPAPGAEAKKRVKHSHVLACAALVGAPCQARLHSLERVVVWAHIKETNRWWH
jgi:hypothetical protein